VSIALFTACGGDSGAAASGSASDGAATATDVTSPSDGAATGTDTGASSSDSGVNPSDLSGKFFYIDTSKNLVAMDPATCKTKKLVLLEADSGVLANTTVSRDGHWLFTPTKPSGLILLNVATGAKVPVPKAGSMAWWSKDGALIATSSNDDKLNGNVLNTSDGSALLATSVKMKWPTFVASDAKLLYIGKSTVTLLDLGSLQETKPPADLICGVLSATADRFLCGGVGTTPESYAFYDFAFTKIGEGKVPFTAGGDDKMAVGPLVSPDGEKLVWTVGGSAIGAKPATHIMNVDGTGDVSLKHPMTYASGRWFFSYDAKFFVHKEQIADLATGKVACEFGASKAPSGFSE